MKHPSYFDLETFHLTLQDVKDVEIGQLGGLSIGVRWPHREQDWEMLRELGHGVVAVDEIGRAVGSAMWFDYEPDFATFGMVITAPRFQVNGAANWLMGHLMAQVGERRVGLNATRAARRLYTNLGFKSECTLFQCQGTVTGVTGDFSQFEAVERSSNDIEDITAFDREAFGASRAMVLTKLASKSTIFTLFRQDRLQAYSFCRRFGRGYVVGPVVAKNDRDAIAVVAPHLARHVGDFVRLDTREGKGEFSQFLHSSGMPVFDTVTTMSYRGDWITQPPVFDHQRIYGVAAQALG